MNNKDSGIIYSNVNTIYIVVGSFICLGIGLFAPEVLYLLTNEQYYAAAWVITILAYNHIFITLSQIAATGLALKKATFYWGIVYLLSGMLLLALNYILIPLWGKEGAALASCLSQLMIPALLYFISQKIYYIPYKFTKPVIVFFFFIVLMLIGRFSFENINYLTISFKLCLIVIAVLSLIKVFYKDFLVVFEGFKKERKIAV